MSKTDTLGKYLIPEVIYLFVSHLIFILAVFSHAVQVLPLYHYKGLKAVLSQIKSFLQKNSNLIKRSHPDVYKNELFHHLYLYRVWINHNHILL